MTAKAVTFGDLVLQFTSTFDLLWNDKKSGGKYNGGYWKPVPPAGFHALGSLGLSNYDDPNGKVGVLCVKETRSGSGALARPLSYERIWKDSGSGARKNGSCWRPVPPAGYVALGDVFQSGHNDAPSLDDVMCVRQDLTYDGKVGDRIWTDKGTGSDKDFGSWEVITPDAFLDSERGLFAPNTFIGRASHDKPDAGDVVHVLNLLIPAHQVPEPEPPELTSRARPPSETTPQIDRVITVPYTAIQDDSKDTAWKLENSPFYEVEREINYSLLLFDDNRTSTTQVQKDTIAVGVTKSQSETFSQKTGISVTAESGVSFIANGKVSATVTVELGWSTTTSVSQFESRTIERTLATPPNTSGALWVVHYKLYAVREDGTRFSQPLTFDVSSFTHSQYPPVSE
ncbi:MAG: Vps62-related protein [Alphaproteobacteria bacterium]|nr:Vps62-related protein [Alphaproteobacteria bacterium]